jgi:hypothetical protein
LSLFNQAKIEITNSDIFNALNLLLFDEIKTIEDEYFDLNEIENTFIISLPNYNSEISYQFHSILSLSPVPITIEHVTYIFIEDELAPLKVEEELSKLTFSPFLSRDEHVIVNSNDDGCESNYLLNLFPLSKPYSMKYHSIESIVFIDFSSKNFLDIFRNTLIPINISIYSNPLIFDEKKNTEWKVEKLLEYYDSSYHLLPGTNMIMLI